MQEPWRLIEERNGSDWGNIKKILNHKSGDVTSFIERLWRSLKYEAVYLHELTDGFKAERVIGEWIDFYNTERPHSSLDGKTPAEAYWGDRPVDMMDKPDGLPTSPPAQQQPQNVINRNLAAWSERGIHLNFAAKLSK